MNNKTVRNKKYIYSIRSSRRNPVANVILTHSDNRMNQMNRMKGKGICTRCVMMNGNNNFKTYNGGVYKNGCECQPAPKVPTPLSGGYTPTAIDRKYIKKWKRGNKIGFTMRSSLKAKGLIPRANGTYRISKKYKE